MGFHFSSAQIWNIDFATSNYCPLFVTIYLFFTLGPSLTLKHSSEPEQMR